MIRKHNEYWYALIVHIVRVLQKISMHIRSNTDTASFHVPSYERFSCNVTYSEPDKYKLVHCEVITWKIALGTKRCSFLKGRKLSSNIIVWHVRSNRSEKLYKWLVELFRERSLDTYTVWFWENTQIDIYRCNQINSQWKNFTACTYLLCLE